jgi:Domain of unknown function (DUF6458)
MTTGVSMFLIAAGAILYFAVSKSVSGLSLDTVGIILMIVGGAGLVISLVVLATSRSRGGGTTVTPGTTPVQAGTTVIHESGR